MADQIYIGDSASEVTTSPSTGEYTGVVITVEGTPKYTAGDTTGKVLEVESLYGTQDMANTIYNKVAGYTYNGVTASKAQGVDPAVELGDGFTAGGVYSGIYSRDVSFGPGMVQTIAADGDNEVEHEYASGNKTSKYATYRGLAAGTTEVNGKGLTTSSVTTSKTEKYINNGLSSGYSSASTIEDWTKGSGAWLTQCYADNIGAGTHLYLGNFELYVDISTMTVKARSIW